MFGLQTNWVRSVVLALFLLLLGGLAYLKLWLYIVAIVLLVAICIVVLIIILLLANLGWYFTKIEQGTTLFINTGDRLRSIWPNVGGYHMSDEEDIEGRHWLTPSTQTLKPEEKEKEELDAFFYGSTMKWFQKWLWKRFGVRFISIFWPHVHVGQFDIRSKRHLTERKESGDPLSKRITESTRVSIDPTRPTMVDNLLFVVPRPVLVEDVELAGDNSRISILVLLVFQQVIPALPVYYLKGDFFSQLDAAVQAAIVDFGASHQVAVYAKGPKKGQFAYDFYPADATGKARFKKLYKIDLDTDKETLEPSHLTYAHWLKIAKGGKDSVLEQHLRSFNVSQDYLEQLASLKKGKLVSYALKLTHEQPAPAGTSVITHLIQGGIVAQFGFALISLRVVESQASKETKDLTDALLAKQTQFHLAEGVRARAKGERDLILTRARGEATRYQELVNALIKKGVDPNIAAQVIMAQIRTENVRDSKLTTYVEGGGSSASIMIPAAGAPPKEKETS